jgi:hypothetical protein
MIFEKNRNISTSLILLLITSAIIFSLPYANATDPPKTWPTAAFLDAAPNPIGVNQQCLVIMFIDKPHPLIQNVWGPRFTGWTIEVTKPNGDNEILGPFTADAISAAYTYYTPDQVGTYSMVFKFPDSIIEDPGVPPEGWQWYTHPDQIGDTYAASTSNTVYLTVQEDPIQNWQENPLPNDYWTRPINAINRNWANKAADWVGGAQKGTNNYNPYISGPESAHILWHIPLWEGGISGGGDGSNNAYIGLNTEGGRGDPIIINGKVYLYDRGTTTGYWGWYSVDLYTGERIYYKTTPQPSFGQVLIYNTEAAHGSWSYLWRSSGSTWTAYDTYTGETVYIIENVSAAGTAVYGKNGDLLRYNIIGDPGNMRLTVWNTTHVTSDYSRITNDPASPTRRHQFGVYDGNLGFSLNVSIPDVQGSIFEVIENEYVIGGISGKQNQTAIEPGHIWALSLQPGQEGRLLWNVTFTPPKALMDPTELFHYGQGYGSESAIRNAFSRMQGPWVSSEEGVFFFWEGATRQLWGYSLKTGQMIWGPTEPQTNVWMMYRMIPVVANGMLFTGGHRGGGEIHAYNITTGESMWAYLPTHTGFEGFQSNPPNMINTIADGKVYVTQNEHTPNMPLRRDSVVACLNATTGEVIWKLSQFNGEIGSFAMSSGYLIINNVYDGRWYCIGKGPSSTTISASPEVIMQGSRVLIKGTVTDQSPGTKQKDLAARYPNGVPAIADEYQKEWMEFLYMQQPCPVYAEGVTVKLYSIDPNGNYQDIGDVTSDIWGNYGTSWKPPVPGEYLVVAEFEGSASYGSSSASTYFVVDDALSPGQSFEFEPEALESAALEPETTIPTGAPLITIEVAIIISAIIVATAILAGFFVLRKRK